MNAEETENFFFFFEEMEGDYFVNISVYSLFSLALNRKF